MSANDVEAVSAEEEVEETMAEYERYHELSRQAAARAAPSAPRILYPKYVPKEEIERRHCTPKEVKVDDRKVRPDGSIYVKLSCPKRGGATRERLFTAPEVQCYMSNVALEREPGKETEPCNKVTAALACADHLTPTLAEQVSSVDVTRHEADVCLKKMLAKGEVSAEYHWTKYRKFPQPPPNISDEELHDLRLGQFFAGEPIYQITSEARDMYEAKLAREEAPQTEKRED